MRTFKAKTVAFFVSAIGLIFALYGCASQPSPPPLSAEQPTHVAIQRIEATSSGDRTEVVVTADQPLTFSSVKQPDPLAVVLYFPNATVTTVAADQVTTSELLPRILAQDGEGHRTARVELRLSADADYAAINEGNTVRLTFDRKKGDQNIAAAEPVKIESQPITPAPAAPVTQSSVTGVQKGQAWVNKIDFLSEAEGKSTLSIGTTQTVDYKISKVEAQKLEIRLTNTKIPEYRQRPLITTRFSSAVDRVVPYQPGKNSNETVIAVELREAVPYFAEQSGNLLLVHFEASGIPPKPLEPAQLPAWKQALQSDQPLAPMAAPAAETAITNAPPTAAPAAGPADIDVLEQHLIQEDIEIRNLLAPRKTSYSGEKIALDFYETDIKNVFRILREVSGKNFAIDKDVTGKVTMTMEKPVPWDQVLDLVLRMNQLGMAQEGEIVRIATLQTLKAEDDLRKAKLEALKKAKEDAKALEPMVTRYFPVSYCNAKSDVQPHIDKILTKERGSVTVDEKNNQLIITDVPGIMAQAEQIIYKIDKVTSQVLIEARVVEALDSFAKELGVSWNVLWRPERVFHSRVNVTPDMAMNFPSSSTSSIGVSFSKIAGVDFLLNARLNALERTGQGRILSSPKILTLNNKKAKIKQGYEYPYMERDSSGGSSVQFKDIDLLLEVTPHVTPDNRVSLVIYITKNEVAAVVQGVPAIATNEAETELLVNDSDTVVIGGIIKKVSNIDVEGFPVLSKIPVLGWAFKNKSDQIDNKELLIFITPRIVQFEQEKIF